MFMCLAACPRAMNSGYKVCRVGPAPVLWPYPAWSFFFALGLGTLDLANHRFFVLYRITHHVFMRYGQFIVVAGVPLPRPAGAVCGVTAAFV